MIAVFVYELVTNARQQGSPISLKVNGILAHLSPPKAYTTVACDQPNVGPILECPYQPWGSLSTLYEICQPSSSINTSWL